MVTANSKRWLGVFFCSVGFVCSTSALGVEGDSEVVPGDPIDPPALFETSSNDEQLPQGQQVEVGAFGQIDLHVKDLDLTKVLQLLSIQSQRNIIASRNVAGTVSADLYGVDFYEALDAILHTNGFGYREKGQFIYVYTTEEIAQLEDENREMVYEIVRLNYITAADASAFASTLLSPNGSIALSVPSKIKGFQPTLSNGGANNSAHQDTLVIRDYAENVEQVLAVIEKLDTRPRQVLVEATILQARLTEANAFGVDFAVFADLNLTDFTTPLGAVDELITGTGPNGVFNSGSAAATSPGNVSAGTSSIKLGFVGSDAAVFVRALDSVTDTTVLAKPQVLVLNRQKVDLLVGARLGYLSTTATQTANTQTVEFLDVGTQLTLRPFISDDDFVRMELRPSVSDGSTSLVGGFVIPDTTTQEIITNVIIRSGQTVVLGGLFKEDTAIGRTNVPGLGNLPVVGGAFKGQDDTITRSEIIFMIKPTIQKDEDLTRMADSVSEDIEDVRLGIRKGLLPWSRTKLTSKYVTDAMQYMKDGNNDKALWSLDKALYLDPTMNAALQLKEQITGEKVYYYDRSILKKAVDSKIDDELKARTDEPTDADVFEPEASTTEDPSLNLGADAGETFGGDSPTAWDADTADSGTQVSTSIQSQSVWSTPTKAADGFEPSAESDSESDWSGTTEPAAQSPQAADAPGLAESATTQPQSASAQPGQDEPAVEAPWRVELTGDDSAWQDPESDGFTQSLDPGIEPDGSAAVEVYDPDQLFADEQLQDSADANQPVNIFEFVEGALEGVSDADTDPDSESEASVTSVDTENEAE
jgi:type IV pilus assembly protein PilQ